MTPKQPLLRWETAKNSNQSKPTSKLELRMQPSNQQPNHQSNQPANQSGAGKTGSGRIMSNDLCVASERPRSITTLWGTGHWRLASLILVESVRIKVYPSKIKRQILDCLRVLSGIVQSCSNTHCCIQFQTMPLILLQPIHSTIQPA